MLFATGGIKLPEKPQTRPRRDRTGGPEGRRRAGFSLVEILIVVTVMGILISMAIPSFQRSMENSAAELSFVQLRSIWSAQRVYWLENRTYASDFATLRNAGLLDAGQPSSTGRYDFDLAVGPTGSFLTSFSAIAARKSGGPWSGAFTITQEGNISGAVSSSSDYVSPGTPYTITPAYP